jgi:hypothetical protein
MPEKTALKIFQDHISKHNKQESVDLLLKSGLMSHSWTRKLLGKLMDMRNCIDRNRNGSQSQFKYEDYKQNL